MREAAQQHEPAGVRLKPDTMHDVGSIAGPAEAGTATRSKPGQATHDVGSDTPSG